MIEDLDDDEIRALEDEQARIDNEFSYLGDDEEFTPIDEFQVF